jgi:hypothetical protein
VKKKLLTCDQVFDTLTRGPFPTGQPDDEAVERHLAACYECRQLAQALLPAVALFHEAVDDDEALDLPTYQGVLAFDRRSEKPRSSGCFLQAPAPRPAITPARRKPRKRRTLPARSSLQQNALGSIRVIAASLLVVALLVLLHGLLPADNGRHPLAALTSRLGSSRFSKTALDEASLPDGLPGSAGLLTLASLKLPATCLPLSHRPLAPDDADRLATELRAGSLDRLRCCTECHHAGAALTTDQHVLAAAQVASVQNHCQACHRG